jgi:hypothetical protein
MTIFGTATGAGNITLFPNSPETVKINTCAKTLYNKNMLPEDEVRFLNSCGPLIPDRLHHLHSVGWSLSTLGEALTPPRPKSTVYNWIKSVETPHTFPENLPTPPPKFVIRPLSPKVPPSLIPELQRLSLLAQKCRARTPPASPYKKANDKLTLIVTDLYLKGVPVDTIAKATNVSARAMFRRVNRGLHK